MHVCKALLQHMVASEPAAAPRDLLPTSRDEVCCWCLLHYTGGHAVEISVCAAGPYACPHGNAERYTPEPV